MSVMVVMPSLAERQQRDPPAIARIVTSLKSRSTPQMRGRISEPRRMKREREPQENSPQQHVPIAENKQQYSQQQHRNVVELVQPTVIPIFDQGLLRYGVERKS